MSGVLSTQFDCNGTRTTWATARGKNPLEPILDFADRHSDEVKDAKLDCSSNVIALPSITSTWESDIGTTTYGSDDGQAQHDLDVIEIQKEIPPA